LINLNDAASEIEVIVRNSRQKKFFKKNLKRPVSFLTWDAEQLEPPKVGAGWVYICDLDSLSENVLWWLSRLSDRFVAVVHSDLLEAKWSDLAPTQIVMLKTNVAQVITSKLRAKKNYSIEAFHVSENGLFVSKEVKDKEAFSGEADESVGHDQLGLSFNLSLTMDEIKQRAQVTLPHHVRRKEGNIEIDSEDSDDPDDDLDI